MCVDTRNQIWVPWISSYLISELYFQWVPCFVVVVDRYLKNAFRGWEDSSVGKMLATQVWEPEFDPQNLQKTAKPQEWWQALAIAELERQRQANSWGLLANQPCPVTELQASKRACLKNIQNCPLAFTCIKHTHTLIHRCLHMCLPNTHI